MRAPIEGGDVDHHLTIAARPQAQRPLEPRRRHRRHLAVLLAVALTAGACQTGKRAVLGPEASTTAPTGIPSAIPTTGAAGRTETSGSQGGTNATARSGNRVGPGPTASPHTRPNGEPAGSPDDGSLGSLARGYLRPTPYTSVVLEIDSAGAYTPDSTVQSRLVNVVKDETKKPYTLATGAKIAGRSCWSDDDVRNTEAANRHVHTGGSTVSLYVLFLDGTYCGDNNVIGFAYGASSMVIFGDATQKLATGTAPPDLFTEAVTIHELGHVFGLVNIGYHSHINHEDAAHPHHSKNKQSVMFYQIDQRRLLQQFISGPPQNFDADDEADLSGLADGTY